MKSRKISYSYRIIILLIMTIALSMGFIEGDKTDGKKTNTKKIYKPSSTTQGGKHGDSYRLNINNINLPLNRVGVIAAVDINDPNPQISGPGGKFGGHVFLFSSGFMLSGYANGVLWANAEATASLIENYVPGTVANGSSDPNAVMYILKKSDEPFGEAWQDWKDAVALGADFYDGDGDGIYDPVEKNGIPGWQADEDAPDLLGDETAWCVFNDGVPAAQRTRFNTVDPLGIEIRQTVFAFASGGAIGNIIFVRYRMKYVGRSNPSEAERLEDVYFGVWADPDLGFADDDLVGCDVSRNAAYTYNNGPDQQYGSQPPAYMIDFFSGPIEYIPGVTFADNNGNGEYDEGVDDPLDTAYSIRGQLMHPEGPVPFPGARNQPLASVVEYLNTFSTEFDDPSTHFHARNYMLGLTRSGAVVDPCTFTIGEVRGGVNCAEVDPRFWFSGDPVTNVGWIGTQMWDVRQMSNTGPFTLKKDEEKEIVVAYVVAQGSDHLDAITQARIIDDGAQVIFNNNFRAPSPPPAPEVQISANEDFIDIYWETPEQVTFLDSAETYYDKFGGYIVYAYQTFSTVPLINNLPNSKVIARYQVDNFIDNIFKENSQTGGIELFYPAAPQENRLDPTIYSDPVTGKIRLRITEDPFTGGPLIKGKPYYFAVTSYAINHDALVKMGTGEFGEFSNYYLSAQSFVQEVENLPTIARRADGNPIIFGEDIYSPPFGVQEVTKTVGGSNGNLQYDVVNRDVLTGHNYRVFFEIDSSVVPSAEVPSYSVFWNLENSTTNTLLVDDSKKFLYGSPSITEIPTEGFIVKLSNEVPDLSDAVTIQTSNNWATANFYYLARDMGPDSKRLPGGGTAIQNLNNNFTRADKLRRVELKFGEQGKAYRYLNGFVGAAVPLKRQSYMYAGGVVDGTPGVNPNDLAEIGQLGVGFIDVPFTAWVEDPQFNEKRQLTVGILERKISDGGNPDGVWDPGTNVNSTGEFIFIFDAPYDQTGSQMEYQGNFQAATTVWADLKGYTIPDDASASDLQRKIAASPFFNVLYALGINKIDETSTYSSGDKLIIDVENYPYTPADVFEFQTKVGGTLTHDEKKSLFDKVNVFPNPLYGFNVATSYTNSPADEPFVTFTNLPEEVTIKVFTLSGTLLRTIGTNDKNNPTSPFLRWDLKNENGLRAASGLYLAIISAPGFGEKILKFSIIMPQKQLLRY